MDIPLAAVTVHGGADTPSVFAAEVPRLSSLGLVVRNELLPEGAEGRGVVVKRAIVEVPCGDAWVERSLPQHVELDDSLGDQKVPQVAWKVGCGTSEHCQEVGLPCADGSLGGVAPVHIGRHKLELGLILLLDLSLVFHAGLVVEDLKVDCMAASLERCHDLVVGGETVVVLA